jgi:flagellar protein FliS
MQHAYNAYNNNHVQIESPERLIEMLYEGILRFCGQAINAIERDDLEKRTYWINRANAIFTELLNSLDYENGGDVGHYLSGLYVQQIKNLSQANIDNDREKLDEVMDVTRKLLETWREEVCQVKVG